MKFITWIIHDDNFQALQNNTFKNVHFTDRWATGVLAETFQEQTWQVFVLWKYLLVLRQNTKKTKYNETPTIPFFWGPKW